MRSLYDSTITFSTHISLQRGELDKSIKSSQEMQAFTLGLKLNSEVDCTKGALNKQSKELKIFNALNDIHATFISNYEQLLSKFNLLNKEHEELKEKFEGIESHPKVHLKHSTSLFNFNPKVDAFTSCDDLIDLSNPPLCNETCVENVVIESSNNLIARE